MHLLLIGNILQRIGLQEDPAAQVFSGFGNLLILLLMIESQDDFFDTMSG
jgi:hypothetical protein